MHIGILQCGKMTPQNRQIFGDYPEIITRAFHRVNADIQFSSFITKHGELPNDINACDAYVISGSANSALDKEQWIEDLKDFIRTCDIAKKKILGICFGHQLIAEALGGRVEKFKYGWGLGTSFNEIIKQKKWMSPALDKLDIIVVHQDQVVELPNSAELVGRSDFCTNYLAQYGNHFLTVQGHPEFTPEIVTAIMDARPERFPDYQKRSARITLTAPKDHDLLILWMLNFLEVTT